jgi:hypothetical protein
VDDGSKMGHCMGVKVEEGRVTSVAGAWGPCWRRQHKEGKKRRERESEQSGRE